MPYSVVFETMCQSSEIAKECNHDFIEVTYNVAIAKIAPEEKPASDHLFVHLGAFHIEMVLLKAFQKVIEESGGPYILN